MKRFSVRTFVIGSVIFFAALSVVFFYYSIHARLDGIKLVDVNEHLQVGGVQLNMPEQQVIDLLGPGEFQEGMGGHGRKYPELGLWIGIAGDRDNDYYGNVSSIHVMNEAYAWFGIKIGDNKQEALDELKRQGFREIVNGAFMNGEFGTILGGVDFVERIQVWFEDKDLRDRVY